MYHVEQPILVAPREFNFFKKKNKFWAADLAFNSLVFYIEFDISMSHSISSFTEKWDSFSNHLFCKGCIWIILKKTGWICEKKRVNCGFWNGEPMERVLNSINWLTLPVFHFHLEKSWKLMFLSIDTQNSVNHQPDDCQILYVGHLSI